VFEGRLRAAKKQLRIGNWEFAYQQVREATAVPGFERSSEALELLTELRRSGRCTEIREIWEKALPDQHGGAIAAVAVANHAFEAVSIDAAGRLRLWDLKDGTPTSAHNLGVTGCQSIALDEHAERCAIVAKGTLREVTPLDGKAIREYDVGKAVAQCATYAKSHPRLVAGLGNGQVTIWDISSGEVLFTRRVSRSGIRHVSLSPNGSQLAATDEVGVVTVWDLRQDMCARLIQVRDEKAVRTVFSPGGESLLVAFNQGGMQLNQLAGGGERTNIRASHSVPVAVKFTGGGRFVTCVSADGAVTVWNIARQNQVRTLPSMAVPLAVAALTEDGATVLAAKGDEQGTLIHIGMDWELEFPDEKQHANEAAEVLGHAEEQTAAPHETKTDVATLVARWAGRGRHFARIHPGKSWIIVALIAVALISPILAKVMLRRYETAAIRSEAQEIAFLARRYNSRVYRDTADNADKIEKEYFAAQKSFFRDPDHAAEVLEVVYREKMVEGLAAEELFRSFVAACPSRAVRPVAAAAVEAYGETGPWSAYLSANDPP
jgi:hypothetical protein